MRTAEWTESVSVLDRLTAVLDAFGDDDGLGVSEIARRANLPKSTVSRIVTDLVRQRYLDREGSRLHLGLKLFELGQAVERPMRLRRLAHPVMTQLRNLTRAGVHLAVLEGADAVLIASMSGADDDVEAPSLASTRSQVRTSALGLAMLANSSEVTTISDPASGTTTLASAILAIGGPPVGAIGIVGRSSAIDPQQTGALVRSAAATMGRLWARDPS